MLPSTAMLSGALTVSTGLDALDDVLGGLYWGDNVVWQFDGTPVEPFYSAIASQSAVFETKAVVSLGSAVNTYGIPGRHDRRRGPVVARRPAARDPPAVPSARPPTGAVRVAQQHGALLGPDGDARVLRTLLPDAARARGDRLLVDERARDAGVVAEHGQRGHAVRAPRRRAQRARAQGRGARRQRPRIGVALARRGRPSRAVAARDRRPRGRVTARGATGARAQPARPRRPRGRDRERDLAGRARRTRPLTGHAGAAERGARGDDRRPGPRRGARQLPDRPPHRRPAARARSHAHAARRQRVAHRGRAPRRARGRRATGPAAAAPRSSPSPRASSRSGSMARRRRSGTARSWSRTASRSTAGATSARRKRCCSGSCSRASRTSGLRESARRTPAGRSENPRPGAGTVVV